MSLPINCYHFKKTFQKFTFPCTSLLQYQVETTTHVTTYYILLFTCSFVYQVTEFSQDQFLVSQFIFSVSPTAFGWHDKHQQVKSGDIFAKSVQIYHADSSFQYCSNAVAEIYQQYQSYILDFEKCQKIYFLDGAVVNRNNFLFIYATLFV